MSDVVHLRDVEKKTWDEIGDLIGRDEKTARRRYRAASRTKKLDDPLAAIRRLASGIQEQRSTEVAVRT